MGLVKNMAHLKVENKIDLPEEKSQYSPDWEKWDRLKISAFHGKKLIKRNFQPYCPEGGRFFLHEIDNFDFNTEKKVYIVGQTFRKLFGTSSSADSSKGRKYAAKLSFLREKGKQYFREGKRITDLIDFPQSYWETLEALKSAKDDKHSKRTSSSKETMDSNKEEDELLADEAPKKKRLRSNTISIKN